MISELILSDISQKHLTITFKIWHTISSADASTESSAADACFASGPARPVRTVGDRAAEPELCPARSLSARPSYLSADSSFSHQTALIEELENRMLEVQRARAQKLIVRRRTDVRDQRMELDASTREWGLGVRNPGFLGSMCSSVVSRTDSNVQKVELIVEDEEDNEM